MLSRRFIPFLLVIIKMSASQSVYPTTAVKYSSNSVPTVQTYPVSPTVTTIPITVTSATPMLSATSASTASIASTALSAPPCSASPISITATPITPTATIITSPLPSSVATQPKVTVSPMPKPCSDSEPKAYFLPANIPDPKVTILSTELPNFVEVKPILLDELEYPVKASYSANPASKRKDTGPMTAVKRVTMACTDEDPFITNEDTVCPGITKIDLTPTPVVKNKDVKSNPIDFEGLYDSFLTCL